MQSTSAKKTPMTFFENKKRIWTTAIGLFLILALLLTGAFLYFKKEKTLPMKYEEMVFEIAESYAVPPELVFAVIYAESSFRPQVVSKHGAMGLMQLMPATYEELAKVT